jgi:alkanesulfonate monooxygenase SsuD/methylene tetrahydromethanopterin reductase-like flavin-dependent oxidoreductase (luciferase family)
VAGGTSQHPRGRRRHHAAEPSPLVIAEQFGTLEAQFPGRIDLGLGRAPGSDALTQRALRRDAGRAERFPEDVSKS